MVLESPAEQAQVPGLELGQATRGEAGLAGSSDNKAIGFPRLLDLDLDAASHMGGNLRMVVPAHMALFHAHHSRLVAAGWEDSAVLAGNTRADCHRRRVRMGSEDIHAS